MTPLIDHNRAMRETLSKYSEMRAHYSSEVYKTFAEWIDALIVQNQVSMTTCGKEKLADAQVRIKQLTAMRSALVDPGGAYTGYTFD